MLHMLNVSEKVSVDYCFFKQIISSEAIIASSANITHPLLIACIHKSSSNSLSIEMERYASLSIGSQLLWWRIVVRLWIIAPDGIMRRKR
jgi:hypothetical protein